MILCVRDKMEPEGLKRWGKNVSISMNNSLLNMMKIRKCFTNIEGYFET